MHLIYIAYIQLTRYPNSICRKRLLNLAPQRPTMCLQIQIYRYLDMCVYVYTPYIYSLYIAHPVPQFQICRDRLLDLSYQRPTMCIQIQTYRCVYTYTHLVCAWLKYSSPSAVSVAQAHEACDAQGVKVRARVHPTWIRNGRLSSTCRYLAFSLFLSYVWRYTLCPYIQLIYSSPTVCLLHRHARRATLSSHISLSRLLLYIDIHLVSLYIAHIQHPNCMSVHRHTRRATLRA